MNETYWIELTKPQIDQLEADLKKSAKEWGVGTAAEFIDAIAAVMNPIKELGGFTMGVVTRVDDRVDFKFKAIIHFDQFSQNKMRRFRRYRKMCQDMPRPRTRKHGGRWPRRSKKTRRQNIAVFYVRCQFCHKDIRLKEAMIIEFLGNGQVACCCDWCHYHEPYY